MLFLKILCFYDVGDFLPLDVLALFGEVVFEDVETQNRLGD